MLYLKTFGGLFLESDTLALDTSARRRKPLALLAALAVAGEHGMGRDLLAALFWPEADTKSARATLRQTIYSLRHALPGPPPVLGTAELRLNPDAIESDVEQFRRALAANDVERAAACYVGPFLEGVYLHGAPAFERWAEVERERFALELRDALRARARAADECDDRDAAVAWWHRLAKHDPFSATTTLGLMRALVATGEPASALEHARHYEIAVREELDLSPDPQVEALAAEIREGRIATSVPNGQAATAPDRVEQDTQHETSHASRQRGRSVWGRRLVVVPTLMAAAAFVVYAGMRAEMHAALPRSAPVSHRIMLSLPLTLPVVDAPGLTFALGPAGTTFVYVGRSAVGQQLFVHRLSAISDTPLAGTEGARTPFFSPDGQWVGFVAGGKIRKVPLRGGAVESVCDVPGVVMGASWADSGIVFAPSATSGLMWVPDAGGTPAVLTTPDTTHGETSHRWPEAIPGGNAVLFTLWRGDLASARTAVLDLRSGVTRTLGPGLGARYSTAGQIIFATADGRLVTQPFDLHTLTTAGPPVERAHSVRLDGGPAFGSGGRDMLIYMPAETSERTVDWTTRDGRSVPILTTRHVYSDPRLSPDDSMLALTIRENGDADVWIYSMAAGTMSRLTHGGENIYPVWTPDGRSITFASNRGGQLDLYKAPVDGSQPPTILWSDANDDVPDSWSPDGKTLFFRTTSATTRRDIWTLRMTGAVPHAEPLLVTSADERSAMISPDGRWLAFTSDESGVDQVYVRRYPGPSASWQVSIDGGTEPLWAKNGRELFYRNKGIVFAARIETGVGVNVVSRAELFAGPIMPNAYRTNYDVTRNGERFVVVESGEATAQLVVIENWLAASQ